MVKNKMRATTMMIVAILLSGGLLALVNIGETAAAGSVTVVINEFMADNDAAVQSPHGNYPDWIELYNYGDTTVDLSGMYLTDNLTGPTWQFAQGMVIGPKNYLLIWADNQPSRGATHTNFKVLANGGALGLFASDGKTLIDYIVYDKQLRDVSFGRIPDGEAGWRYMDTSTPGAANIANTRDSTSTPWPIWIVIILALVACVGFVLKDKIRSRRKK